MRRLIKSLLFTIGLTILLLTTIKLFIGFPEGIGLFTIIGNHPIAFMLLFMYAWFLSFVMD